MNLLSALYEIIAQREIIKDLQLTKINSEIFARARKLVEDKKPSSVWTWNDSVYFKRVQKSGPTRLHSLLDLER